MPNERTRLILRLDIAHSKVVRLSARRFGAVTCYTCDRVDLWHQMTCGHLWSRKCKSIRWDFDNCRPQCYECQGIDNGRRRIFEDRLREEIGEERVAELLQRRDTIRMWRLQELRDLLAERKQQLKQF